MLSFLVTWAVILLSIQAVKKYEKKHGTVKRGRSAATCVMDSSEDHGSLITNLLLVCGSIWYAKRKDRKRRH